MTNFFSLAWGTTLVVCVGFAFGAVHTYKQISASKHQTDFRSCLRLAEQSTVRSRAQHTEQDCRDLFGIRAAGRYGPQSETTIRLAAVDRPILTRRF